MPKKQTRANKTASAKRKVRQQPANKNKAANNKTAPAKNKMALGAIWIGSMHVGASDMTIALMDGEQLRRWTGDAEHREQHEAVRVHFHNYRVDLWRTIDGFAFVWAYPDTGTLGSEFKRNARLQQAMGTLLASLETHKATSLGRFRVRSGCVGLIAEVHSGTHVTATDLEKAKASQDVTNIDLQGEVGGNLGLIAVPPGLYELSEEELSPHGVYEDEKVGEIHKRISVRAITASATPAA